MAIHAVRRSSMERRIIRISAKRQITIPQKYYEVLGFNHEAECILQDDAIVIRPIGETSAFDFSEQILSDLIAQGYSGQELLAEFKKKSKRIAPAINALIHQADCIAKEPKKGAAMADIFGTEEL
jgi:bifunctional DNA-binding transcriptional regulator/antitoxin component of YhaV-PrlF toxin-antitoxin module